MVLCNCKKKSVALQDLRGDMEDKFVKLIKKFYPKLEYSSIDNIPLVIVNDNSHIIRITNIFT
ncbi:MAG UNVERIFIED_CONTAM: hypothetical protein LVQ98_09705 [Rickettsiaceae bacterium]